MRRTLLSGLGLVVAVTSFHAQATTQVRPSVHAVSSALLIAPSPPLSASLAASAQSSSTSDPADAQRALVKRYCVTCHNQRLKTAGLALDQVDVARVGDTAEVWEKVVRKVRSGAMPPAAAPRPDKAAHDAFLAWLEAELDRAADAEPNPGRPVVRRLNRLEYTNAIRDLLALEVDGRALLPTDESGYGFDNIGDVLAFSPGLLERYLTAARKISRLAVGDLTLGSSIDDYRFSQFLDQTDRLNDDLPFGTRGGAVIRHHFTRDGAYRLRIRLGRRFDNEAIQGLARRELIDVRLDGANITTFQVGGECVGSKEPRCIKPPGIVPVSEYERAADEPLQVQFRAAPGLRQIGIAFVRTSAAITEGAGPPRRPTSELRGVEDAPMSVESVRIEGPLDDAAAPAAGAARDTPSRRRIFICSPKASADEEACASKILSGLARHAYRRQVHEADLRPLVGFYRTGRAAGGFEAGVQFALEGLLVAPDFLLRLESDPAQAQPGSVHRISDVELASRLSFFLWSSIPDEELLDAAVRGTLSQPDMLKRQVRRMIADPRSSTLVTNFASQWLYLKDLRVVAPDTVIYPTFDESLRVAFQRETELFLESQLREDRSVVRLLDADYTFVNERLARFYGIPNVYGSHFRRVPVTNPNRKGLLGHASLLTVTSYSNRTSVVQRGKFVLDNFLGAPPPPPPPDVEALPEPRKGGEAATLRARMEAHRKKPVCSTCHATMDPIGFALENFDAIGNWRSTEFGARIDATGALPGGTTFEGPAGLRDTLLGRSDEFVLTLVDKLLTYALGRGTEYFDRPAIRRIVKDAASAQYTWSSLILGVVNSTPFRMRSVQAQGVDRVAVHRAGEK
jgi:mono/diheme cytochrome c family protein